MLPKVDLALIGNNTPTSARIFGGSTQGTSTDQGAEWLATSQCSWIPANEGQGLRLSGAFARPLNRLSLRLRYQSPVALLACMENVIGGPRGLAYTLNPEGLLTEGEVITLRTSDPTPELDRAIPYRLDGTDYLQPKDSA